MSKKELTETKGGAVAAYEGFENFSGEGFAEVTVLNETYDGEKGVFVIPCHYNRRFVEWKTRENGGGYVDSYEPTDPVVKTTFKNDTGQDMLPNGNMLSNTAQFFDHYRQFSYLGK